MDSCGADVRLRNRRHRLALLNASTGRGRERERARLRGDDFYRVSERLVARFDMFRRIGGSA